MDKNDYWIWLARLNILPIEKIKLLELFGLPNNIYHKSLKELVFENIHPKIIDVILDNKYRENLEKYRKYLNKNDIEILTVFDKNYPKLLKLIYDYPICLFVKGNIELLNNKLLGIIGSRNCSTYGAKVAKKIAEQLSKNNITIVSGLAEGIDSYAHIGAIKGKGNTIAVIGAGHDYIYPFSNKELYQNIIQTGGLIVSEYIVGTKPSKETFPQRNRIISGLSKGILVVEARRRSGTSITVNCALEQGRDIYVIPGDIEKENSIGTNNLIKEGAKIITEYIDILEDF